MAESVRDVRLTYPLSAFGSPQEKAFVFIQVINAHDINANSRTPRSVFCPALIDSGADFTFIPTAIALQIGYNISAGKKCRTDGIAGETVTYQHRVIVRLVKPEAKAESLTEKDLLPGGWPIMACVSEYPKDFALLGCHDFLSNWEFSLNVSAKRFSLSPIQVELRKTLIATAAKKTRRPRTRRSVHRKRRR